MQVLDYERDAVHWRPWFAWYPLLINGQAVWLRTVLRRSEYRKIAGVTRQCWVYRIPRLAVESAPWSMASRERAMGDAVASGNERIRA